MMSSHYQINQQYAHPTMCTYDEIQAVITPFLPPPQVTTFPVSAAVELIALRLGMLRPFVKSTMEVYLLDTTVAGGTSRRFLHPSELVPLAVHIYTTHCQLIAPTSFVAPLPLSRYGASPHDVPFGFQSQPPTMFASAGCPTNIPPEVERKICKQFRATGVCTFGSRCLYHHSVESAMQAVAAKEAERAKWSSPGQPPQMFSGDASPNGAEASRTKRAREPFADLTNIHR
jgi:hypothetical protein